MKKLVVAIDPRRIQLPGWKSNLSVLVALLISWATWANGKDFESYLQMLDVDHFPGLVFVLAPIVWTWLLNPPRRKDEN